MKLLKVRLQLFADGGTGAQGTAAAGAETGVTTPDAGENNVNSTAEIQQKKTEEAAKNPEEAFEELINGKYKEQFEKRVHGIVERRLKGTKANAENLAKLQPLIDTLASRYSVDSGNIDGIIQGVMNDTAMYEQEAVSKGLPVETVKQIHRLEAERNAFERTAKQAQQEAAQRAEFVRITEEAKEVKKLYPSFELKKELNNPNFVRLIQAQIPVKTAFEAIHANEIMAAIIPAAVDTATKKVVNSVKANSQRPVENALSGGGSESVSAHKSVSEMSRADRAELIKRALSGEKIKL